MKLLQPTLNSTLNSMRRYQRGTAETRYLIFILHCSRAAAVTKVTNTAVETVISTDYKFSSISMDFGKKARMKMILSHGRFLKECSQKFIFSV